MSSKRNTLRLIGALATVGGVAIACGQGRAIFNVDVLSFMQSAKNDTLAYNILATGSATVDGVPVKVGLIPGLGSSTADSVTFFVGAAVENKTGAGTFRFKLLFAPDSAGTYTSTDSVGTGTASVTGLQTVPLPFTPLTIVGDPVFSNKEVWVLLRSFETVTAQPMTGTLRLNQLRVRVVIQDKPF